MIYGEIGHFFGAILISLKRIYYSLDSIQSIQFGQYEICKSRVTSHCRLIEKFKSNCSLQNARII